MSVNKTGHANQQKEQEMYQSQFLKLKRQNFAKLNGLNEPQRRPPNKLCFKKNGGVNIGKRNKNTKTMKYNWS